MPARLLAVLLLTLAAGCSAELPVQQSLHESLAAQGARLDTGEALRVINTYRRGKGLGALTLDPALTAAARSHAEDMARHDKVGHTVSAGPLGERLKEAGVNAIISGENIGAGYHTIAEAFSGWRGSPDHDKIMRLADANRMGIAAAYAPQSKYRVFWTLIVVGREL